MRPIQSSPAVTLESLKQVFQHFRQSSECQRPITPDPLRRKALAALAQGFSFSEVAAACGISTQTLKIWKAKTRPAPRKLEVVPDAPTLNALKGEMTSSVTLRFPNGLFVSASLSDAVELVASFGGLST